MSVLGRASQHDIPLRTAVYNTVCHCSNASLSLCNHPHHPRLSSKLQKIERLLSKDVVINIDQPLVKLDAAQLVQFRICYEAGLIQTLSL